jgi:hypothetical protein
MYLRIRCFPSSPVLTRDLAGIVKTMIHRAISLSRLRSRWFILSDFRFEGTAYSLLALLLLSSSVNLFVFVVEPHLVALSNCKIFPAFTLNDSCAVQGRITWC